jgi:hypothetical protein
MMGMKRLYHLNNFINKFLLLYKYLKSTAGKLQLHLLKFTKHAKFKHQKRNIEIGTIKLIMMWKNLKFTCKWIKA